MQQLNTSILSVLASKGELLQACKTSPHIWENIFGWISFTEQCLFYNAQQQLSDNESSYTNTMDDPFLYGIRRRLDGMWEDFNFAQQLLDYLDSVLIALLTVKESHGRKLSNSASAADVKGYTSQSGPVNTVREASRIGLSSSSGVLHAPSPQNSGSISDDSESSLLRLMLRLTLYTLHETDAFMNTEAIQRRRNTVKDFETIIFESFETAEGLTVKEGMSAFLQEKSKLWNQEMASAQQTYQRNIKRLTQIVNRLIVLESEANRLLYVLNFLYKAMRRSYEQQGVGTELILGCFREVLVSCRFRLPLPVDTQPYNDEQLGKIHHIYFNLLLNLLAVPENPFILFDILTLFHLPLVNYVMTQLSFPSTGDTLALSHRFEEAVLRVINEEAAHRNLVYLRIEKDRQILTNEIKKSVQADQTAHSRFLSEYEYFLQTHAQDEFRRLSAVVQRFKHKQQLLERKWKYLNRSLFGPRAPWASSDEETEEKIANVLGFARGSNLTIPGLSSSLAPLIHWKLDQTEDMSRRHRRFKRNYSFDPHLGLTKRGVQPSSSRLISPPQDNLPSVKLAPSALELESTTPSPSPAATPQLSLESSQSLQQVTPTVKGSHLALQTSLSNPNLSLDGSASASGTIPAPVPSIVPGGEKTLIKCMCELITPMKYVPPSSLSFLFFLFSYFLHRTTPGQLEITSENIYLSFDKSRASDNDSGHSHRNQTISNSPSQPAKNRIYKWPVTDVRVIYRRRYMLRNSAVELSLSDNTCYFLNFETEHDKVFKSIAGLIKQRVALDPRYELASGSVFDIVGGSTTKPTDIIKKSGLTDKWVKRKISTFDYLMQLNTIAGRTYNDLTQVTFFQFYHPIISYLIS
jgi:hypothetical protein